MEYLGYTIVEETDPWPLKAGYKFRFFPTSSGDNGEDTRAAVDLRDVVDQIDDIEMDKTLKSLKDIPC